MSPENVVQLFVYGTVIVFLAFVVWVAKPKNLQQFWERWKPNDDKSPSDD